MSWQFWIDPQQVAQQAVNIKDSAPMALPFMMSATNGAKLSFPRLIEAVIIAAISGGLTMWVTVSVINAELEHLKGSMHELKEDIKELRRDVYNQVLSNKVLNGQQPSKNGN
jgi:hypothetical protein